MLISKTPFRISLVGGGTDLPGFFENHPEGGSVVSFPIKKYIYISINKLFQDKGFILKYSKLEKLKTADDIKHRIIKAVFNKYDISGVDFNSVGDFPAKTGMGSSSAFTVGILHCVRAYLGLQNNQVELGKEACEIELDILNEPIGLQDQYGVALGGIKHISFRADRQVDIRNIQLTDRQVEELSKNLVLFFIGNQRSASDILSVQSKKTTSNQATKLTLIKMKELADNLAESITNDIQSVGSYLHENWILKRTLTQEISSKTIDNMYEAAIKNGAIGGKLLGAGGGGFMLFYCPKPYQSKLKKALYKLQEYPIEIDTLGTRLISTDTI